MTGATLPLAVGDDMQVDIAEPNVIKAIRLAIDKIIENRLLLEIAWPSVPTDVATQVRLVPLERMGAAQGISGSHVFVCYIMDRAGSYRSSKPLTIKVGPFIKLEKEHTRARDFQHHPHFAIPIHLEEGPEDLGALVAPFSSWQSQDEAGSHALKIWDLRAIL
ncbi:MAG: hypothetical protein HQL38_00825, partial [Alphaproteobacteria bacterium]|nr:hypothetical protein [Alphaproteobacteria bacterium]